MTPTKSSPLPGTCGTSTAEALGVASSHRRRRDAVRNRAAVITAACALLEDHDAAQVTMDAVAARAGVGKGTVFRHFQSREGLMLAMLERAETRWWAGNEPGVAIGGSTEVRVQHLLAFGEAWTAFIQSQAAVLEAAGGAGLRRHLRGSSSLTFVRELLDSLGTRGDTAFLALVALVSLEAAAHIERDGADTLPLSATRESRDDLLRRLVSR